MGTARKAKIAGGEWITLAEAARILGESRLTVLSRSVRGEITASFIAGRNVVSRSSIAKFLATRGEAAVGVGQSVENAAEDGVQGLGSAHTDNVSPR